MIQVRPTDLKLVAKVSAGAKTITPCGTAKNYWNSVHRIIFKDKTLTFRTTDKSNWLDWKIPVEDSEDTSEFDVLIPALQFNDMASHSAEGALYELKREDSLIHLTQGRRHLRIREESPQTYPEPTESTQRGEFVTNAGVLAKALKFVTPFIDATNPTPAKSVATYSNENGIGTLTGGSPKRIGRVVGLTPPAEWLSFKQSTARAVADFLSSLEENVKITLRANAYIFTCQKAGHTLHVLAETSMWPQIIRNLSGNETEVLKVDNKNLYNTVQILATLLPAEADRLNIRLRGLGEDASVRLSTYGEEQRNSSDEIPIIRKMIPEDSTASETNMAVNCRTFKDVLSHFVGTSINMAYYATKKLIFLEDEQIEGEDTKRSVLMTVQALTDPIEAEKPAEQKPTTETNRAPVAAST